MRLTAVLALAVVLAGTAAAWAEEADVDEHDGMFKVLDKKAGPEDKSTLGDAVGTFDRALGKFRSGEKSVVNSNLQYNQRKLKELRHKAGALEDYLRTFWERVAVHFERLKADYGSDTASKAYRKAALTLKEEYEQREAEAKRRLAQIKSDITRVELRIAELSNRKRMNQLESDLRGTDLGPRGSAVALPERAALPTRADKAFALLGELSRRKVDRRVGLLVSNATIRSAADHYFERQIAQMLRPKEK